MAFPQRALLFFRDRLAPLTSAYEMGDVDTVTVEVVFNEPVVSADFTAGVTIEVNAAPVVIASGTLQSDYKTVYYVIPACDINDTITWAYSGGSIKDQSGNSLADITAQTVTNYIGSHYYFHNFNCGGHLVHL